MIIRTLCAAALAAIYVGSAHAHDDGKTKVTLVYDHALPNVSGKSIKGVLVEYAPGATSPAHTHPASAFIYATVLQGAIRSQVNDGLVVTYHAGESFSEKRSSWCEREREQHGARAPDCRVRGRYQRQR